MRAMQRRTSAWLACLLILGQMMIGPLAHSMSGATMAGHCTHAAGMTDCAGDDCGMCPGTHGHAPPATQHGHSGALAHARCSCPCATTPALATTHFVATRPWVPVTLPGELQGPAFSPPIFDFLRPPN